MADNIQTIGINVTDNGTTEALTKKIQSLKKRMPI